MTDHSAWVDVTVNIGCVAASIKLVNYLGYKRGLSVNLASSLAFSAMMLLFYSCAKLLHVSFLLVPIGGGIPWNKPNGFLLMMFLGVIASACFAVGSHLSKRSKNKL